MTLHINGDPHQVPAGLTVASLLLHLGIDAKGLEGLNCHYAVVDDWSRGG